MDETRRRTLLALIDLAGENSATACWDDQRAIELLRKEASVAELREVGADERLVAFVFPEAASENSERSREREPVRKAARPVTSTFTVRVQARFESAHYLREYRGISEPLHGHSYMVEADLAATGGGLDSDAIAVDFVSAKKKLEELARRLDYGCINDVEPFTTINPSAENIASWFARELQQAVEDENAVVIAVTLWEGPVNSVTYRP